MSDVKPNDSTDSFSASYKWIGIVAKAIAEVSERLGLGVFLSLIGVMIFDRWSSVDQKHRLIEMLVFGNGIRSTIPFVVAIGIFLAVIVGQQRIHRRKIRVLEAEVSRIAEVKSTLQQKLALPTTLQHAKLPNKAQQLKPQGKKAKP